MKDSLIQPETKILPTLNPKCILCFNLGHFFSFREQVQGTKPKPLGPSKYFHFEHMGEKFSVIGGMIGGSLSLLALENALAAGAKSFIALGTAGWIEDSPWEAGAIFQVKNAWDRTGMGQELGLEVMGQAHPRLPIPAANLVSVAHFYDLSPSKLKEYRDWGAQMIDMEMALCIHFCQSLGISLQPVLILTDGMKKDQWEDQRFEPHIIECLQKSFELILEIVQGFS